MDFLNNHPIFMICLIVYAIGVVLLFIWTMTGIARRFIWRNGIRNRNFWLIGMEINWVGGLYRDKEPGKDSMKDQFGTLFGVTLIMMFNALCSWILLVPALIAIPIEIYQWIIRPSSVRDVWWRASHILYQRAEDFLALAQEGYLPGGKGITDTELEEARTRVEEITLKYADKAYSGDVEKMEKYVDRAKTLSKEKYHSAVIHPDFWMIPAKKFSADRAIGESWIP